MSSATRAVGLAVLGVGQDQVDVGGKIQFAAAELAEAQHDEALRLALGVARQAVTRAEIGFGIAQRRLEAGLGQRGGTVEGVGHAVQAVDVAPDQPQRLAFAEAAQQRHLACFGALGRIDLPHARVGRTRIAHEHQRFGREQGRIAREAVVGEVAREQHTLQLLGHAGVVVERHAGLAAARKQVRVAVLEEVRRRKVAAEVMGRRFKQIRAGDCAPVGRARRKAGPAPPQGEAGPANERSRPLARPGMGTYNSKSFLKIGSTPLAQALP